MQVHDVVTVAYDKDEVSCFLIATQVRRQLNWTGGDAAKERRKANNMHPSILLCPTQSSDRG